jgi:hypothetical protein
MFATKPSWLYGKDTDGCSAIHEYVLSGVKSRSVEKALAASVGGTSERSEEKQSGRSPTAVVVPVPPAEILLHCAFPRIAILPDGT